MADTETTQTAETRGRRKTRIGVVSSDKMQKTVVVTVNNLVRHPIYGRTVQAEQQVQGARREQRRPYRRHRRDHGDAPAEQR